MLDNFLVVLINTGIMLLYAVPGFILSKTKLLKSDHAKILSTILLYICSPLLNIYAFQKVTVTTELSVNLLITFGFGLVTMLALMMLMALLFRKKNNDIRYRVATVCAAFGNEAFLGVPLVEAILPGFAAGAAMCTIYLTAMNILGWTLACYLITKDKKYISIKRILLNPATIGLVIAVIFYFLDWHFVSIPKVGIAFDNFITILSRMSTPLCMIALGMRLASTNIKSLFLDPLRYVVVSIKQFAFPLVIFAVVLLIPIDVEFKKAFVILSAVPSAQITQSFCELIGEGQEDSASNCLLSTLSCILTLPLICLLFELL